MPQGGQLSLTGDSSACFAKVSCALHASAEWLLQTSDCYPHSTAQHSSVVCAVRQLIVLCPLQWTVLEHIETMQLVVDGSRSALQHSMAQKAHHGTL